MDCTHRPPIMVIRKLGMHDGTTSTFSYRATGTGGEQFDGSNQPALNQPILNYLRYTVMKRTYDLRLLPKSFQVIGVVRVL